MTGPTTHLRQYDPAIVPVPDDAELVAAAREGDHDAVEQLLRRHQDRIHAVCRRLMADPTDALDAAQEAMISVVRGLPRFDGRAAFTTWIYRITTNACLDELRRRNRRPTDPLPEVEHAPDARHDRSTDVAGSVADRIDVDAALATLLPDFRAPVVLRDLCQLDYAEIAEVLDIPPGTVRSRIARGRAALASTIALGNQPDPAARPTTKP